ncbi:MAG: hypothetical protein L6R42_007312 [Xanthoria sp. 1 TBL-2021]|nr:MAG: hypothetical protein L6R42_007312 [Xanthoria sp. 1 TBL-2021]
MQRDTPLTTTPAQRRREARESRRTTRQLPAVETDIESSEEPANEAMSVNSNNLFPSFLDNNSRPPPPQQVNGNGGPMNGINLNMPMNAGHQMDVNMLYQKILELSEMLRENREQTQAIVAGAEELATRAAANGATPSLQEANAEISAARIAELEKQLAREQNRNRSIMREQKENTRLIGEYETAVGNIVEMVRNYSYNNKQERSSLSLHYNKLLQDEKDAHLAARLEKDDWQARFMRSVEMLREAYKLRCEEEEIPIRIVSGLQNEVRAYRNALGMEPEKEEEEYGWELLKDAPDAGRED